jgi:Transposase
MKFTRRPDLDPQTRIEIVKHVWINQGTYGKMVQIAQAYQISRTFLYQLSWAARHHLELLFSDSQHLVKPPNFQLEPWILLLRLEGKCSIPSISSIFKHFDYEPSSVGYLSQYLQDYGRSVPSTLSMEQKKVVFYLSDEIFAIQAPILVTIDAQSTAILKIELASDRSAKTWATHFKALNAHRFHSLGMASDRGVGLKAGYQAACQDGVWVCDHFHEFQELYNRCHQLERQAYRAIAREHKAAEKFANAKSEANLQNRLEQYERARHACQQAIERYDQLDFLLHMLSEALQLCSDVGRLRIVENVRSELTLILSLIEAIDDEKLPKLLKTIRSHLDDILVPFRQVEFIHADLLELIPEQIVDALVLAWHHDHLSNQSHGKKKDYHRWERDDWLNFSEGLLDDQFDEFKARVFEKLDSVVKASSLVEMVNSLIRPYLNNSKGQITQETLNLIMFYHNHRRYKGGKRQGKAPIELLTGETLQGDWIDLLMQHRENVSQEISLKSSPSLELVPHRGEPSDDKAQLCKPPVVQTSELQANSDPTLTVMDAQAA